MVDALAELTRLVEGLGHEQRAALVTTAQAALDQKWLPNPGPQTDAYLSEADLLLYGGAAGGGKTDLIVGLALAEHQRVVIFRRSYGELSDIAERFLEVNGSRVGFNGQDMRFRRGDYLVEFGALEKPGSEKAWRGRAHDLIAFDEGAELSQEKISFVLGWLRSTDQNQRCRAIIATNPPTGGTGDWLIKWFAPWLDPLFPDPARNSEIRWAIQVGDETVWKDGPGVTTIDTEQYTHESRTFIPARLNDNPYLKDTGYRARIQNMPEPLRSQLLNGDFLAGREDHAWQVIPTAWVAAANQRWEEAEKRRRPMIALAADVALGGGDRTVFAALHADAWFATSFIRQDKDMPDKSRLPAEIAAQMILLRKDGADLSVDGGGGYGSGVRSHLVQDHDVECAYLVGGKGSMAKSRDGKLGFKNFRAQVYWQFREALDPEFGDEVKLPPNARLMAELTASRYTLKGTDILIEKKEDVTERIGSSPDEADAHVNAWNRRNSAVRRAKKIAPPPPRVGGWMAR
jgi:hypothetical protein